MASLPAEPGPAAAGDSACPRCGAPYGGDQEYCLECGHRLPAARGVVGGLATAWRRRLGGYPGDWIWPVLLFALIAIVGAVAAVLLSRTSGGHETLVATNGQGVTPPSVVATIPTVTAQEPTSPGVTPSVTGTTPSPPSTGTVTQPPPARPASRGPIRWPAGRSGYTVVLESIPRTEEGRRLAVARARQAIRAGVRQVGILDSGRFSSLHPGYWVVFGGVYGDKGSADSAVSAGRTAGFSAAYSRRIVP